MSICCLPLKLIHDDRIPVGEWLKDAAAPILIAQNEHDPLGSYEEVKAFIDGSKATNCTILRLPGDTHSYDDIGKLRELMERLLIK